MKGGFDRNDFFSVEEQGVGGERDDFAVPAAENNPLYDVTSSNTDCPLVRLGHDEKLFV